MIFIINFFIKVNIYVLSLTSAGLILIVLLFVLLYLLTMLSNLSIYTFFDIEIIYLKILVFKVLISLSATAVFPLFYTERISINFFSNQGFSDLLKNLLALSTLYLALVIVVPFHLFHEQPMHIY